VIAKLDIAIDRSRRKDWQVFPRRGTRLA